MNMRRSDNGTAYFFLEEKYDLNSAATHAKSRLSTYETSLLPHQIDDSLPMQRQD